MSGNPKADVRVWGAMVGFGVLAGCAFVFVKVLVNELTPLQLVAARTITASVAVAGFMLVTRTGVSVTPAYLRGATILALLDGFIPYVLIAWAEIHVASGVTAVLVGTMPLFTTLFAALSGENESVGSSVIGGFVAGFLGVAVLASPSTFLKGGSDAAGIVAVVGASACYAGGAVYARPLLKSTNAIALTGSKLVLTAAAVTPFAIAMDGGAAYGSMSAHAWFALGALGFGSTGLGRCAYLWAVGQAGSVRASMVTYIAPVVAILLGWLVLHEAITANTIGGSTLIILGLGSVAFGSQIFSWLASSRRRLILQVQGGQDLFKKNEIVAPKSAMKSR